MPRFISKCILDICAKAYIVYFPFDDPRPDEGDLSEREPEGRPGKKKKSRGEVRFFRMSAAIWSDPNLHLKRFTANGRYLFPTQIGRASCRERV